MTRLPFHKRLIAVVGFILLAALACSAFFLLRIPHWGAAEQTSLHSAILADDLAQMKLLLPEAPRGAADEQLFYARSASVAEFLLSSGASVKARAHGNYTPLHFAAAIHAEEVVTVLLEHGADVNAMNDGKTTPLMLAVGFGGDTDEGFEQKGIDMSAARQMAVIQALLKAGAKVDMRDSSGMTALGDAVRGFNAKGVVPVLVEAGANVNVRSVDGDTPLHLAAFCGDLATVRYLVEHGADITAREWQGKRPIDEVQGNLPDADEMRKLLSNPVPSSATAPI